MATLQELALRLDGRFSDVPNIKYDDVEEWVETSMNEHGFDSDSNVPSSYVPLILLFAEAEGAGQIALKTAHYFSFVDKDESIDKTMITDNYRKLADSLWARYRRKKNEGIDGIGGSAVTFMRRVDRP